MREVNEYLDLVNNHDEVIGRESISTVYEQNYRNIRCVNAFIINDEGKLWIPRRAASKQRYPLTLDMSMGGHVSSGETYDEAFRRELLEELNIDTRTSKYELLGKLTPQDSVSVFMQVYQIRRNDAPRYNTEDFVEWFWLTPDEVITRVSHGEPAKSDLVPLVRRFYGAKLA